MSYAVAMAASVQTRDLRDLEVRLRHLLQYVSSHPHLGLYYPYPTSNYRSLETFTDASFAPSGSHSHQGFAVLFKVGHSQHLLHWSSTRQKLVSQSSAEAELIALMSGFKATKSFQHLLSESVADLTPILRCDNQAVLAMLEKPSWRARHISIRGEALRQAKDEKDVLITYASTQNQVADPLTKPTSPQLNKGFYPKWGLVTWTPLQEESQTVSDRDPCRPPGRRRTGETSSVSACEALTASNGSRDLTQRAAKFLPDSFQVRFNLFQDVSPLLFRLACSR